MKTTNRSLATEFPDDLRGWLTDADLLLHVLDRLTDTCLPLLEDEEVQHPWSIGFSTFLTWTTYSNLAGYFGTEAIRAAFPEDTMLRYISLNRCPSSEEICRFRRAYRPL